MVLSHLFLLVTMTISLVTIATAEIIDMTHPLNSNTLPWPGQPPFTLVRGFRGMADGGYWYEANSFSAAEHLGTHLDAPRHFHKGGLGADEIPVSNFIVPAVVLDISTKASIDSTAVLSAPDIEDWQSNHGDIPSGSLVLVYTGWSRRWPNKTAYFGTDSNSTDKLKFPSFGIDAAEVLSKLDIVGVGIDSPSVDSPLVKDFKVHQILAAKGMYNLENLTNVSSLPPRGATVYASCLKITGGSGAPCRVIANVPDGNGATTASGHAFALSVAVSSASLIRTAYRYP